MTSSPPSYRGVSPPPPYESLSPPIHDYRSPQPAFEDHPHTRQSEDVTEQKPATKAPPTNDEPEPAEGSTGKNRVSFIQAYKDKRRAKEAARKVDYYERLYGFVPKNVMSEAEWRDARERVPRTKVPFRAKGKGMTALGLGVGSGGFGGGGGFS